MGRARGARRLSLALLAGGVGLVVAAGAVVVVAVLGVALFFGSGPDPAPGLPDVGCGAPDGSGSVPPLPVLASGPRITALDADQTRNARTIVQVAAALSGSQGFGSDGTRRAAVIGIMTAMQESSLHNLNYGDRDSLGLFQQRAGWASAAERTTPASSAKMFYTGGHAGQPGLFAVPGWRSMPLWAAAQAVQVSAFPTAYAKWERTAEAVVATLLGGRALDGAALTPAPQAAVQPTLKLPDNVCVAVPVSAAGQDGAAGVRAPSLKGWVLPLTAGSYVPTSPFGWRVHPILHDWRLHTGQDLGAPLGTPVYAVAAGRVVAAGPNDGYGNQIVLDHGDAVQSAYDHLSTIVVPVGARVRAGQLVGRVGSTGVSTAPHLHFEIRLDGRPVDPVPYLRARGVLLVTRAA
jgi:murein DD-endopeptidase MepM/ murein hydrolase activator NlpD